MILKSKRIIEALNGEREFKNDPLWIVPLPSDQQLKDPGASSIDLRLGRWFLRLKQTRHPVLRITSDDEDLNESTIAERHFVRFGAEFILHPRSFVLASTLEWIKIPQQCSASIVGKSSWGRRGLIIETAPTVHPGFSGCLTLEMTNVGEVPIALIPGMTICQLVLQKAEGPESSKSSFQLTRRPSIGSISLDKTAATLAGKRQS